MKKYLADIISVAAVCLISLAAAILIIMITPIRIIPNGDTELTIGLNSEYTEQGATAIRTVFDHTDELEVKGSVNTAVPGTYEITYSLSDRGRLKTAKRTVTVKDINAPEISLKGEEYVEIDYLTDYEDPGVSAFDDVDGDLSSAVTRVLTEIPKEAGAAGEDKNFEYIYTATDKTGNKREKKRYLHVRHAVTVSDGTPDGSSFICLTFDDGPSIETTNKILDILMAYGVKATFFVCDYGELGSERIKRIVDEGHNIAIHTQSHEYSYIYSSPQHYLDELSYMQEKIYNDTGYKTDIIRFPGGSSNTISESYCLGVMTQLADMVHQAGYEYYDWNADSGDANGDGIAADTLYNNFVNDLCHDRTNIVLMHDTDAKKTTAQALPRMIEYGIKNGYEFLPITKTTPPVHHTINN